MLKLIITIALILIAISILLFFYCAGKLNKYYDVDMEKAWEKEFEGQEWD